MNKKQTRGQIDWMITLLPLGIVVTLCVLFFFAPEQSNAVLGRIRFFFGDTLGTYYLVIGLGIFLLSIYIAASKYGSIVLGEPGEKPKYSFFAWGCMMFTCGLAADILFYSFSEWVLYASDPHIAELGSVQDWAGVFPLFHWSFIRGAFIWCWPWRSASCSMSASAAARSIPRPAVPSSGGTRTVWPGASSTCWRCSRCWPVRRRPSASRHRSWRPSSVTSCTSR